MINNQHKEKALLRIKYEIAMMHKYCKTNKISYAEISDKSGVTRPNVSRFLTMRSAEPSVITFLLISEAIGYKMKIER